MKRNPYAPPQAAVDIEASPPTLPLAAPAPGETRPLYPVDAHTAPIKALARRQAVGVGVLFGALFPLGMSWLHPGFDYTAGLVTSVAAAGLFGWGMTRSAVKTISKIYDGVGPYQVAAPRGDYQYRVLASLKTSRSVAVGGVLFLGRGVLTFVPQHVNLAQHRGMELLVDSNMAIDTIPMEASPLLRVLVGKVPRLVRVASGGQEHVFVVLDADETARRIREIVLTALR